LKSEEIAMKKYFLPIVLLVFVLQAIVIPAASAGPTVDKVVQKKVLVVGTSADLPPLTFKTRDGQIAGLDIELGKLIARALGTDFKVVALPFPELIPALEKGTVDLVISSMTITPKRNLRVAFAGPYSMTGQSLLTTKEIAGTIKGPGDMNRSDFVVAVSSGTTSEQFMKNQFPQAGLKPVKSKKEALSLLLQEKVQAIVADFPFCQMAALRYRDRGLVSNPPFTLEPVGIAVRAEDPLFLNLLQNFLTLLQVSGEMKKLTQPWFEDPSWIRALPEDGQYL